MKNLAIELREDFQTRFQRLVRELRRAIHFDRPLIVFSIYDSIWLQREIENDLQNFLATLGHQLSRITLDEQNFDIPSMLEAYPDKENTVFSIIGLDFGGVNAYYVLNLRREIFIEYKIRVILWLTEDESIYMAQNATDFWSFRHRVIEFTQDSLDTYPISMEKRGAQQRFENLKSHLKSQGDTQSKIDYRLELLQNLPHDERSRQTRTELALALGGLYREQANYNQALHHIQQALHNAQTLQSPNLLQRAWHALGSVYGEMGEYEPAIEAYRTSLALEPNAAAWVGLGDVYFQTQRYPEAIAAYRAAIELDEKAALAWNGLGNVYFSLGQHDAALESYQRARFLDPNNAHIWNNLGNVYASTQQYKSAMACYTTAIEVAPTFAAAWFNVGQLHYKLQQYDDAIAAYHQAMKLDPHQPQDRAALDSLQPPSPSTP